MGRPVSRQNGVMAESRKGMTPQQKQMLVSLVFGLIVGIVISWLTGFWLWLPAGLAVGLATGVIMKPPTN